MRFSIILIIAFVIVSVNAAVFQQRDNSGVFKSLQDKLKDATEEFDNFKDEIKNLLPSDGLSKITSTFNQLKTIKEYLAEASELSCLPSFRYSIEEAGKALDFVNSFSKKMDDNLKALKEMKFGDFDFDFSSVATYVKELEIIKIQLVKCAVRNLADKSQLLEDAIFKKET